MSQKLKALLTIAAKVQQGGRNVTGADVERAKAEGATDTEIHDAVLIAAAFCMFNRYVDGLATLTPTDPDAYDQMGQRMATLGYVDQGLRTKDRKHYPLPARVSSRMLRTHGRDVGRALAQPAHEVGKPLAPERNVDAHAVALLGERGLQIAAHAVQQLKLESVRADAAFGRPLPRQRVHGRVVCGKRRILAAFEHHLHQPSRTPRPRPPCAGGPGSSAPCRRL